MCDKPTPEECKSDGCVWLLDTKKCVSDVETEKSRRQKASDTARGLFGGSMVAGILASILCVLHEKKASEVRKLIVPIRKKFSSDYEIARNELTDKYTKLKEKMDITKVNVSALADLNTKKSLERIKKREKLGIVKNKEIRKVLAKHNMVIKRSGLWLLFLLSLGLMASGSYFASETGYSQVHPGIIIPFLACILFFVIASITLWSLLPVASAGIYACIVVIIIPMIVFAGPKDVEYETSETSTDSQQ